MLLTNENGMEQVKNIFNLRIKNILHVPLKTFEDNRNGNFNIFLRQLRFLKILNSFLSLSRSRTAPLDYISSTR